ncbi:MAG: LytTR family DNA-binding domain-containing protein [Saprospiraceae bacterium]|nr:response regulator transcription factor [Lewinella sp.]
MSTKIKCLVVDDEPMALKLIESYVLKTPFLSLEKKCANAFEVMEFLSDHEVDLIFLDIQMPELSGIQLSKVLPEHTRVVFTTAFDQYAVESYKVDALDYLLKPFNYEEFLHAATKAQKWFALKREEEKNPVEPVKDYFFIKSEYKQIKVKFENILYIESLKEYLKIWVTTQKKPLLTLMTLKKVEEELPADQFMRIHRSYIIALDKIDTVERNQVIINDQRITVSEPYRPAFHEFLERNSL